MSKRLWAVLIALAFVAAACGADDVEDAVETAEEAVEDEMSDDEMSDDEMSDDEMSDDEMSDDDMDDMSEGAAGLQLASTDLGDIIVDIHGNTIYLFTPDAQSTPTCLDGCVDNWPLVVETIEVGEGLDADLLGSVEHPSGVLQATYNGWPLYYFANDAAAGDTNGQGVNDVWFVIDAAGNAIS